MSDFYEELVDENDRLKVILDIKERELRAARKVVQEAYWHLAYQWQSHMFDVPKQTFRVNMSMFAPEVYQMMTRSEQELYDALAAYETAMGGPDETSIRAALEGKHHDT
jgi:hypothetical protein